MLFSILGSFRVRVVGQMSWCGIALERPLFLVCYLTIKTQTQPTNAASREVDWGKRTGSPKSRMSGISKGDRHWIHRKPACTCIVNIYNLFTHISLVTGECCSDHSPVAQPRRSAALDLVRQSMCPALFSQRCRGVLILQAPGTSRR